jgi:hypothetical protein
MNARLCIALAIALAFPCFSVPAQDSSLTYDPSFTCSEGPLGLRLPQSYQAVRSIGKLERDEVVRVQEWETYQSEDRELTFSGLKLYVVTFTNDKSRYMVAGAVITGSQWSLAGGIKIGDSVEDVLRRTGKGTLSGGEVAIGGDTDIVRFGATGGKVTEIRYECYTG